MHSLDLAVECLVQARAAASEREVARLERLLAGLEGERADLMQQVGAYADLFLHVDWRMEKSVPIQHGVAANTL